MKNDKNLCNCRKLLIKVSLSLIISLFSLLPHQERSKRRRRSGMSISKKRKGPRRERFEQDRFMSDYLYLARVM